MASGVPGDRPSGSRVRQNAGLPCPRSGERGYQALLMVIKKWAENPSENAPVRLRRRDCSAVPGPTARYGFTLLTAIAWHFSNSRAIFRSTVRRPQWSCSAISRCVKPAKYSSAKSRNLAGKASMNWR